MRPPFIRFLIAVSLGAAWALGPIMAGTPGAAKTAKTKALESGAALLQDKPPLDSLNSYMDGFHFASGLPREQMEAHHYCAKLNEDVTQCVIFDGNTSGARLMGVEYIVSEKLFKTLSEDERRLWHSHAYEVTSGQLVAPGIPLPAERALMEQIVSTYGKTWHTWDTHLPGMELPLGIPRLMAGFTADGQIDPKLVEARDRNLGISTSEKRRSRQDIAPPPIQAGADDCKNGRAVQLERRPVLPPKNGAPDAMEHR
jgi:hypothetical protein